MKIVISTGIFPPAIGGPAQYAKNLAETFTCQGNQVKVLTYQSAEKILPSGLRHLWFYFRCLRAFKDTDLIIALDTLSVGWPSVCAAKKLHKKVIIRTGGDFLWEGYVERTGKLVLLSEFYQTQMNRLSWKERKIFKLTKDTLNKADKIIFSTDWQRQIWLKPYGLDLNQTAIVENFYGEKEEPAEDTAGGVYNSNKKIFVAGTRKLKWKNLESLKSAFNEAKLKIPDLEIDLNNASYDEFQNKIKNSYAVILVSLGDISPNLILDAIRQNKPFILTKENGLYDRIRDIGIYVDPMNVGEITRAIETLSQPEVYADYLNRIKLFNFTHSWSEIAQEFIKIANA